VRQDSEAIRKAPNIIFPRLPIQLAPRQLPRNLPRALAFPQARTLPTQTHNRLGSSCVAIELRSTAPHNSPSDGELSRPPAAGLSGGIDGEPRGGSLLATGTLTDLRPVYFNEVCVT
jgi:hypothetical protein